MREACILIYHQMVLAVLQWEGELWNPRHVGGSIGWPLVPQTVRPQTEGRNGGHNDQDIGGQDVAAKSGASILDIIGEMEVVRFYGSN